MEVYKIVEPVKPVVNKAGAEVEGVWDIKAVPVMNNQLKMRAVPTYETVANLDSGYKNKPEYGATFLGEVVNNVLYIIKYIDVHPRFAEESSSVPKYKDVGNVSNPGEWSFKSPALNFISILRNGVIKIVAGMGSFIFMDPYIPGRGVLELLDRLVITAKNFIFNVYGGSALWTNFKEDDKWKSELAVDIYRGQSIDRDENNNIQLRLGSLTADKTAIADLSIKHTTEDNKIYTYHKKFADDGTTEELVIDKVEITELVQPEEKNYALTTEKVSIQEDVKSDQINKVTKTEKVTVTEDVLSDSTKLDINANGHTLTVLINSDGIKLTGSKNLNLEISKDANITVNGKAKIKSPEVTINSKKVTITGDGTGELNVQGTVGGNPNGPFNSMMICPFTGAPHAGTKVTNT